MKVHGFDKETMRKFFMTIIENDGRYNSEHVPNPHSRCEFSNRAVPHTERKTIEPFTADEYKNADFNFKNYLAFLYLKTFYGKSPASFREKGYREECNKFLNYISTNKYIKPKIKDSLSNGIENFDYRVFPQDLFYEGFKSAGLGTDTSDGPFLEYEYPTQMRFYLNPSAQDYGHFLKFFYTKVAENQIFVSAKTRLDADFNSSTGYDGLVLYLSDKDFIKVIEILNEYQKCYPEKTKKFGPCAEGLGYADYSWYGFGSEGQRLLLETKVKGMSTFNSDVDNIMNYYIFPIILLKDFNWIESKIKAKPGENKDITVAKMFQDIFNINFEDAYCLADLLRTKPQRLKLLKQFGDLSSVKTKSENFTKEMAKIMPKHFLELGYTPDQVRERICDFDLNLLGDEKIQMRLMTGKILEIERHTFENLIKYDVFRDALIDCYKANPKLIEENVEAMSRQFDYLCKSLPYISDKHPFLTPKQQELLDRYSAEDTPVD